MDVPEPLAILWLGPDPGLPPGPWRGLLASRLAAELPDWRILVLAGPWHDLRPLERALAAAVDRPVVVAAPGESVPVQRIHDAAASAGLDPNLVFALDPWLGHGGSLTRAARLVAAAAARVASAGSTPAGALRLRLPALTAGATRRGLFTALRPRYEVIPWVNQTRCRAGGGCDLCAAACPAGAISTAGGVAALRAEACSGCAACTPACPTGAIAHPAATEQMLVAEITALLRPGGPQPAVVAYACPAGLAALARLSGSGGSVPDGVLPVPVPCAAAVPAYLLLRPLELGAAAVALLACAGRCRLGASGDSVGSAQRFASAWLALVGEDPRRASLVPADPASPAALADALERLVAATAGALPLGARRPGPDPAVTADPPTAFAALGALLKRHPGDGRLAGPWVPFGRVAVDAERCTLCGLCASACPTGALALLPGEVLQLRLNAAVCAGCSACARACPEGAVHAERAVELAEVQRPGSVPVSGEQQRCRRCGSPYAPAALAAQVGARLARAPDGPRPTYLAYCPGCRVAAALAPGGVSIRARPRGGPA